MQKSKRIISIILALILAASMLTAAIVTTSAADSTQVYFDNSEYNWEEVYIYVYGGSDSMDWPGKPMEKGEDGMYSYTLSSGGNVLFNNNDNGEQYPAPKAPGLVIKSGQCKILVGEQWMDYVPSTDHAYCYANVVSGATFASDSLGVTLGLRNADKGYYSVDGSPRTEFTDGTTIAVGQGKIANTKVTLDIYATGADGEEVTQSYTYKKTFTQSKTTISAASDGHTTEAESTCYYGTNPELQLGKYKTISVDGNLDDWDSSMIIAQGQANDDPRVYMPSSMHEIPIDAYALYSAWDDENLYFMWEMTNTTYIISPSDNFAASDEARPYAVSYPMYIALSIDPTKQATGAAIGTNKDGSTYINPYVWGCDGGVATKGGTSYTTHIDTLVAFDSNNSNGGASIFKADTLADDGTYLFNYDTRIPIGVTSWEKQDNQNGFKIKFGKGTISETIYGVNAPKGSRVMGDNLNPSSNFADFYDLGYKKSYGYFYEVAIPLAKLGIDRSYVETNGIGAMLALTYGTSSMDTLPHDQTTLDNANVEYGPDPSTSHEKDDADNITVPLARVGALLSDTKINEPTLEVNFGADRSSGQAANTALTLSAESYHSTGSVNYEFKVNGTTIQNSSASSVSWTPTETGKYEITVVATDSKTSVESTKTFSVGEALPYVPETTAPQPSTEPTTAPEPSTVPEPSTEPTTVPEPTEVTEPSTGIVGHELGDVDNDGKITIDDATLIQKYVASMVELTVEQCILADVDNNGKVEINDVTLIQKYMAGMVESFG